MGVSWKLAINYLKNIKKRSSIIGICIFVTTVLITTVLLLLNSYQEYRIAEERKVGNWEVRLSKYYIQRGMHYRKT